MQTSFETLLKFSDEKESEKECLLRDNIKKEVAATTLNESIFEHKADATWSTTIEEEQLATIILEEELSKIKSEAVIGRKNRRERNKSFVIDYIVNDLSLAEIAEDHHLCESTVSNKVNRILHEVATSYFRVYYDHHPEAYQEVRDSITNWCIGLNHEKRPDPRSIKKEVAWLYHEKLPSGSRASMEETYENIREVEKHVYQKKITRIG